jgi:hypothetical protein
MTAATDFLAAWVLPISIVATFVLTLLFSTKIKDFFNGIPADLRADLSSIESATLAKVKAAQKDVVASVTPPPAPVIKPAVPAAPTGTTGPAA